MTKGCYTCRRRRIICDNGLPTCRKCRDAGKECLGYQKPLVWVKGGIASRGRMMGRTYDDVNPNDRDATSSLPFRAAESTNSRSTITGSETTGSSLSGVPDDTSGPFPSTLDPLIHQHATRIGHQQQAGQRHDRSSKDGSLVHVPSAWRNPASLPTPWGLIDPLFKDINHLSRFYLSHFNEHLLGVLALYPHVKNPYRNLMPLVGDSPVLAHTFSALGALHYALLANGDLPPLPSTAGDATTGGDLLRPPGREDLIIRVQNRRSASGAYENFLNLKQRALRQISANLQDKTLRNDDRTVAAILSLALLDVIESGSGEWKYHLEGAKNLLKSRGGSPSSNIAVSDWLDQFVVDGCLIIEIMGSTLARPGSLSKPIYAFSVGPDILRRLEETSWVGCPAYLLEVIFFVHTQWYSDVEEHSGSQPQSPPHSPAKPKFHFSSSLSPAGSVPLTTPSSLLEHIQAFDPIAWAQDMQKCLHLDDLTPRIALAAAYKAAVYLYAGRVFSSPACSIKESNIQSPQQQDTSSHAATNVHFSLPRDFTSVADQLIKQICLISQTDPHFKCLIWPTFIAGAECRFPSQRAIVLDRLNVLYHLLISVNVRNAAWVLKLMWQTRDLRGEERRKMKSDSSNSACDGDGEMSDENDENDDYDDDDFDWIQELVNSRVDWLFI